jgi:putative Holliday junction resolvase
MRSGRRLAIDVGKVRIGIAVSDVHAILASSVATVKRLPDLNLTVDVIFDALKQNDIDLDSVLELYVGLPTNLKGLNTESTEDSLLVAKTLSEHLPFEVRLVDERLTTVSAAAALRASGINSKKGRNVIDQVAATLILEHAMELEKSSGKKPGKNVRDFEGNL